MNGPHCGYTVAMEPNEDDSEFLNIYLVGKQSGWVAVGFSYDQQMVCPKQTINSLHLYLRHTQMYWDVNEVQMEVLVLLIVGMIKPHPI